MPSKRRDRREGPSLAIVGAPNVGKSTLFNRLVGRRAALVDDSPGVTRDCKRLHGQLGDLRFPVIDTGGVLAAESGEKPSDLNAQIRAHALAAAEKADLTLLLIDGAVGLSQPERDLALMLRRRSANVIVGVNKCDRKGAETTLDDALDLGFEAPIMMSAAHGIGLAELCEALDRRSQTDDQTSHEDDPADPACRRNDDPQRRRPLRVAVIGRPNVGKSTLINRLADADRLIAGPEPGITRDAVEIPLRRRDGDLILIDTAGMRKKSRVAPGLESLSISAALSALRFCDAALLVTAADAPVFELQERRLAALAHREKRGLVVAVNKCDLIADRRFVAERWGEEIGRRLPPAHGAPIVALSARDDDDFSPLFEALKRIATRREKRIGTGVLNRWLAAMQERHRPPVVAGRRPRLRYITQIRTRPPAFALFCSRPQTLSDSYRRYLEAGLSKAFDFGGAAPQIRLRRSENPYVKDRDEKPKRRQFHRPEKRRPDRKRKTPPMP